MVNIKCFALKQPTNFSAHYHKRHDQEECIYFDIPIKMEEMYFSLDVNSDLYLQLKDRGLIIREMDIEGLQEAIEESGGFGVKLGEAN